MGRLVIYFAHDLTSVLFVVRKLYHIFMMGVNKKRDLNDLFGVLIWKVNLTFDFLPDHHTIFSQSNNDTWS